MKKNNESLVINETNIFKYTTNDRDVVMEYAEKNRHGFPTVWPTHNGMNKKIILSFVDAYIIDKNGNRLDDTVANFDILEEDTFDKNDKLAKTKIRFLSALFLDKYIVCGGVYYRGKFFTYKMNGKKAAFFMQSFLNYYFCLEDVDLIKKYFCEDGYVSPFWPTKDKKGGTKVIFSAVNATISRKGENVESNPYNFDIKKGDILHKSNADDRAKLDVIYSLFDKNLLVKGFYYKGKLVPSRMTDSFRLYLEKGFVKKNFTSEQRDTILSYVKKDKKTLDPIFWPTYNANGEEIALTVVDASTSLLGFVDEKYSNFDVLVNESFNLSLEEYQNKLEVIQALLHKESAMKGCLYLDGILVNGSEFSDHEIQYRIDKVEKILRIHIDANKDFSNINKKFSVNDKEAILNVSDVYDKYYPNTFVKVPHKDPEYAIEKYLFKVVDANVINMTTGKYIFKNNISFVINEGDKITDENHIKFLSYFVEESELIKIRGGIFFKGLNIRNKKGSSYNKFVSETLQTIVDVSLIKLSNFKSDSVAFSTFDKKTHMPTYWPTRDKDGRSVLLSVVDSDVHFKTGRRIVKAVSKANFDIYEGETFGLVGESGSGKTTISRAILRINKLAGGGIYYRGRLISSDLSKRTNKFVKKNIQMIFQDPSASLNERANIDYIVSEGLYNFHMFKSKEERLDKVVGMLRSVGLLPEHLSRYPHEFSGGQRQRIGIARALIIEPQLVLADEPISALDVSIRAQVLNLLKSLQRERGLTYLFIAHDLSIIRYISDRIAVMHNGHIVELGNADEIYSHPLHPYTQSLLTAIPQPDPKTKDTRKRVAYEQGNIDYDQCSWEEFRPGHFVLVNDDLRTLVKKRVAAITKK